MESINIVFSNDAELLRLNKEYLNHDYLTDIVTFELSPRGKPKTGDLYISYDRVRENAYQHTTSFKHELHRVIIHGVLHLCGYKDKTKAQTKAIRNRENFYLDKYFG